jgi:hypothetical protein
MGHNIKKYLFRRKVAPMEPLYHYEGTKTAMPAGGGAA